MNREQATQEIKARWRELYPADGKGGTGKGIICPLCGSGGGRKKANGDPPTYTGITEMPNSRNHFLKCWNGGCKFEGGSVIDLYMLEHGIDSFSKAVDELAAELRITIDPYKRSSAAEDFSDLDKATAAPQTGGNPSFSGTVTPAAEAATGPAQAVEQPRPDYAEYLRKCMANLAESAEAQAYLTGRGISLETAQKCCIGFDPAWRSPTAIRRGKKPPSSPRIIIPSTTAHYVARDVRSSLDEQQRRFAKMNEGEPAIMGSPVLYSGAENVFVVEGAFDALSIIEAGQPAIALNSTSNIDRLLKQLEQQPTAATLILCLDNDDAGKKATARLKEGLNRLNISYVTADINGGHKDPNEALQADRGAFEQAIAKAIAGTAAKPDNTSLYIDTIMGDDIKRRQEIGKKPTGFSNLDAQTGGGLRPGLFLLGAISSLGKTTFCSQLADGMAENGADVIYFSLEQSRLEMMAKSLSRETARISMSRGKSMGEAVTGTQIMDGYTPPIVLEAAQNYKSKIGDRISIIEAGFNADTAYIADYVRRYYKRTGKRPVVIIDYLQVLKSGEITNRRGQGNREIVEECIAQLVLLKRELDLTIITIVSLNRANYMQPFDFESIKETGLAEYSGDVVWGLQLRCLDDTDYLEAKTIERKRELIRAAKGELPRKVKLCSVKHRGQQAIYDCAFEYYPQYDLFVPKEQEPATPKKAGRRL